MQDRSKLTDRQINDDLLRPVQKTGKAFWIVSSLLALELVGAMVVLGLIFYWGLGFLGIDRPVMWAVLITNFVFWVGISHAGVMISSILRLTHAEWRRPVTRAAEVLTIFSLITAALFPVIHSGRPWRTVYWTLPYDFTRGIWPNVRSPLIWDPSAIFTYLTGAALFIYTMMIPDLAILRDRTTGIRSRIYGALSLGWRGTARQWRFQGIAGILISGIILPVFVSVHSIVSWDFAMALVPSWHSNIFAPYFVIGAIHSGVSAVTTLMFILRRFFHLERYITPDHFDALGRLLIPIGLGWFFFFFIDFTMSIYSQETVDVAPAILRLFTPPYNVLFVIFIICAFIIPVPAWFFRRVRRSPLLMLFTTLLVNVGMWFERFLIIVPGLLDKQPLTFTWGKYNVMPFEVILTISSFCLVALGVLLFTKVFPIIPIWDQKEGQKLQDEIRTGRRKVPAVVLKEE